MTVSVPSFAIRRMAALVCCLLMAHVVSAQKFGYLSHDSVLKSMNEYATVKASLEKLREQYAAEQKRVEDDFNQKYESFLDGQSTFPLTILRKRQSELQEMLERSVAFKQESLQLLQQAEVEAMAPLEARLAEVLNALGQERGYAFILNTDEQRSLWINPDMGDDITAVVKERLRK